jgi:FkbM family methyltransferase
MVKILRLAVRRLLKSLLSYIPHAIAKKIIRLLMESQGLGSGARVQTSGELNAIRHSFRRKKGNALTIFDVGANRGEYSIALSGLFPTARIYAFEPSPNTFKLLVNEVSGVSQIDAVNIGFGNENETTSLYKENSIARIASLTELEVTNSEFTERVRIRRLDDYLKDAEIQRIDLLKIDVEGHEWDVLQGAISTLKSGKVFSIQFEFGEFNIDTRILFRTIFRFLKEAGYTVFLIQPHGLARIDSYEIIYEYFASTNFLAVLTSRLDEIF